MIDDVARCGYGRCRAELPAPGPRGGRPRSFCRDTRWEGDRSCAQMARAERDALDSLGLDSGGTGFRLDADRLRDHVDAVREPVAALLAALDTVTTRLDDVQAGAVAAVDTAHRQVAEAEAARLAARHERERAEAATREARDQARRAVAERAEAVERAAAAARQALETTEALGTARQEAQRALADRAEATSRADRLGEERAAADTAAREAALRAERASAESEAARARAQEWQADGERLRAERDAALEAGRRAADAAASAEATREGAEERAAAAERAIADGREAWERAERELLGVRERVEGERALRLRADAELDRLRVELAEARSREAGELRALLLAAQARGPAGDGAAGGR